MADKKLLDKSTIDTTGYIEAHNLGYMCRDNSYRSLKNKPYVPTQLFYTEDIVTGAVSFSGSKSVSKGIYTTAHPKAKYRAIGLGGYVVVNASSGGKNCSYCRLLAADINGDNAVFNISNKAVTKGADKYKYARYKTTPTSVVQVKFRVIYVLSDAYQQELAKSNIECSHIDKVMDGDVYKGGDLLFYAGTSHTPTPSSDLSNVQLQQ